MPEFVYRSELPAAAEVVWNWHAGPGALPRLTPPWEDIRVVDAGAGVVDGSRVMLSVPVGPIRMRWVAEHRNVDPPRSFQDVQVSGPFARWEHTHEITPISADRCELVDRINFAPPLESAGGSLAAGLIRNKLQRTFAYRHRVLRDDLTQRIRQNRGNRSMTVLITGASGLIGSNLRSLLETSGHSVRALTRSTPSEPGEYHWQPRDGQLDVAALDGCDAVIHLAGEGIASGRWTKAKKRRIRASRVESTRLLAQTIGRMPEPRPTLIVSSAIGYYGDRGDEVLTEDSAPGDSFLAEVCKEWEDAADPARAADARVVHVRTGIVLSPQGGALANMLPIFKAGAGGRVGSGRQYWSWISIDDIAGIYQHVLENDEVYGVVNGVAPNPVTNREFTKTLGRVLRRFTIAPLPAFAARLMLGEMANELLLASARVEPVRTRAAGYQFRHPELEQALRHVLGR